MTFGMKFGVNKMGVGRVGRYQKKHSPTHTHPDHRTSFIIFLTYNDPWHPLCSVYELDNPLRQHLSRSSLVFLLALDPQLHTPCISSPNHHHYHLSASWVLKVNITRSSAIAEGPRDASCQLKSCQLPRNSAETTYTASPDQIDGMKLEI